MIPRKRPKFIDSPFFVPEPGNWHLKDDAPPDVVREFEAFKRRMDRVSGGKA